MIGITSFLDILRIILLKQFISFLSVLLLIGCGPAGKPDSNTSLSEQKLATFCLTSQSQCQINTEFGDFEVTFAQTKVVGNKAAASAPDKILQHIRTELPFSIVFKAINQSEISAKISTVSGHLEGKDMFMGKVPVFFNKEEQGDKFTALSLLASCSEDIMVWRLWLTVTLADKESSEQTFFIDFESIRL